MMTEAEISEIFASVQNKAVELFPDYTIQMEPVPESPMTRAIAVYGVPAASVKAVRAKINDLGWEHAMPHDLVVLARVVNAAVTAEYYPELMPKPATVAKARAYSIFDSLNWGDDTDPADAPQEWVTNESHTLCPNQAIYAAAA